MWRAVQGQIRVQLPSSLECQFPHQTVKGIEVCGGEGWGSAPHLIILLQPGAPNVLEQGPERGSYNPSQVQMVSTSHCPS